MILVYNKLVLHMQKWILEEKTIVKGAIAETWVRMNEVFINRIEIQE